MPAISCCELHVRKENFRTLSQPNFFQHFWEFMCENISSLTSIKNYIPDLPPEQL